MMSDDGLGHVVVVYESMFGNTEAIARSIAKGLTYWGVNVDVRDAPSAPTQLDDVDLVIVGAPTHAFGMPRASTRDAARQQGATVVPDIGVRDWLHALQPPNRAVRAACFDTRLRKPFPVGSAARGVCRRLRDLGFEVAKPAHFVVSGTPGPLAAGELERARGWAAELVPGPRAVSDAS